MKRFSRGQKCAGETLYPFRTAFAKLKNLMLTNQKPNKEGGRRLTPKRQACVHVGMISLTEFTLAEATAVLTRTPATLNALLSGLPNVWVRCDEGKDTWSAFDIPGNLISGERTDWMPRVRIILEDGEARAFDPFDRFAQSKESQEKSLEQRLDDFARLRGRI